MIRLLWELFIVFFKIGVFTFGGGYAMISVIEDACAVKKKWITHDEMMDITVMAESTPGPIAINMATYVGFRQARFAGAAAATIGIVLPSFLIILLLASWLDRALNYEIVQNIFRGIRVAVPVLILDAGFKMIRKMNKKPLSCLIAVAGMAVMFLCLVFSINFSSLSLMLIAGAVSLAAYALSHWKGADEK